MNQEKAIELALRGFNVFITGEAGTGKSYILDKIIAELRELKGDDSKIVAITASTGVAATKINGKTIHSWSGMGTKTELSDKRKDYDLIIGNKKTFQDINYTDVLIIDEISMLRGSFFDSLNELCKRIKKNHLEPFGGIQIILSGDFLQLPPVQPDRKWDDPTPRDFCFLAKSWEELNLKVCCLDKIYRQTNKWHIDLLNDIRNEKMDAKTYEKLNYLKTNTQYRDRAINLFTTNDKVKGFNGRKLNDIIGKEEEKEMIATTYEEDFLNLYIDPETGYYTEDKDSLLKKLNDRFDFFKDKCLAEETLKMKVGAQVMFIYNDFPNNICNGTLGVIVDLKENHIEIIYKRDDSGKMILNDSGNPIIIDEIHHGLTPIVKVYSTEKEIHVTKQEWYNEEYDYELEEYVKIFSLKQIPLKLAWAITVHKSQGCTFDYVNIDLSRPFGEGLGYVALSRASWPNGIWLASYVRRAFAMNKDALEANLMFIEKSKENENL